jgi:hypothetical protein
VRSGRFCGTIRDVTGLAYQVISAGLTSERVDRAKAQELYEQAAADPRQELVLLVGNPVAGFGYWVVNADGVQLVRKRVEPIAVDA